MHENLKRSTILGQRPVLKRIKIRLAILRPHRNRHIEAADQQQIHQQPRRARVAVAGMPT